MPGKTTKASDKKPPNVSPTEYIEMHGHTVDKMVRVYSPGESDFGPYETFLFLSDGKPKTAVIVRETLVVRDGWDVFYVECY